MMELTLAPRKKSRQCSLDHRPAEIDPRAGGSRVTDLFARSWLRGDPPFEKLANEIHLPRIFCNAGQHFPNDRITARNELSW